MWGKRSQVAQEFIMFVGITFILTIVILNFVADDLLDKRGEKEIKAIDDIGFYVQGELVLAAGVRDGYTRTFYIPEDSDMMNYTIAITNNRVLNISGEEYNAIFYIPYVIGSPQIGNNTIRKDSETLYLNS
jgi:hypothetical protein